MAGLGIRNSELARVLSGHAVVTVAHGGRPTHDEPGLHTVPYRRHAPGPLRPLIANPTHRRPSTVALGDAMAAPLVSALIFDLYDAETLETLELLGGRPAVTRL